jgi:hypothetical protein
VGRPERRLDPAAGPLQAFAVELRNLRESAGRPKYSTLAQRTGRSQTALSEAAGGQRLPSWETVEAFVRGCGSDPSTWRLRWEEVAAAVRPPAEEDAERPDAHRSSQDRRQRVRLVVIGGTLLLLGLAGWGIWRATTDGTPAGPAREVPSVAVADGTDPVDTHCSKDPQVTSLDTVGIEQNGVPVGQVQLKYAPWCGAAWARFLPFSKTSLKRGTVVHVDVIRPADGKRAPFQSKFVGEIVFGNMLRSTESCVVAAVRIGADAGGPETRTACFRGRVLESAATPG